MSEDRRRHRRIHVEMWVEEHRGPETYFRHSANLSPGGIYLDGSMPHPKGTQLQLQFTLPGDEQPVTLRGEVVGEPDIERLGLHIQFVGVPPELLARLRALHEPEPETV